jgi:hypothetical protein
MFCPNQDPIGTKTGSTVSNSDIRELVLPAVGLYAGTAFSTVPFWWYSEAA